MSLFGALFHHAPAGGSGTALFSEGSKYKAQQSSPAAVEVGGKRKADGVPKADGPPMHAAAKPPKLAAGLERQDAEPRKAKKKRSASKSTAGEQQPAPASPQAAAAEQQQQQQQEKGGRQKKPKRLTTAAAGLDEAGGAPQQRDRPQPSSPAVAGSKKGGGSSRGGKAAGAAAAAAAPDGAQPGRDPATREGQEEQAGAQPAAAERAAAEAEKLQRTVFVGNLQAAVRKKALQKLFARYGTVESVRVRSLPVKADAKMPRKAAAISGAVEKDRASAHAYVVFAEASSAEAALAHNMQEFEGLHLRVDRAAPSTKGGREAAGVHYDPARSLFVGNLPLDVEDEEVIRFFIDPSLAGAQPGGGVEAVRVVRDPRTSQGKGIAYVLFASPQACKAALLLDGKALRGRPLRVARLNRSAQQGGGEGKKQGRAAWQGTVTKGRGKQAAAAGAPSKKKGGQGRGGQRGAGGPLAARPVAGKRKAAGKRPAVAARKQQRKAGGKRKAG